MAIATFRVRLFKAAEHTCFAVLLFRIILVEFVEGRIEFSSGLQFKKMCYFDRHPSRGDIKQLDGQCWGRRMLEFDD
jgi:hypothetical protein